jgi:hypothetical protein
MNEGTKYVDNGAMEPAGAALDSIVYNIVTCTPEERRYSVTGGGATRKRLATTITGQSFL